VAVTMTEGRVAPVSYIGRHPILAWPIAHPIEFGALIFAMVVMLFGPKFLALAMLMRNEDACRAHGGKLRATLSVVLESLFSILLAPIAMLSHCWFVVSILSGRAMGWRSQKRREYRPSALATLLMFTPHTLIAFASAYLLYQLVPESFWWFTPLLVGGALAVPIAYGTSSRRLGLWVRRAGLLLVPSETRDIPIVKRLEAAQQAAFV
jgi:membrane glycosyltransferase